jgi:hypothetical protein
MGTIINIAFFDGFDAEKVMATNVVAFFYGGGCCEEGDGNKQFPFFIFFGPFGLVY